MTEPLQPNRHHLFYDTEGQPITADQWAQLRETDAPRVALTEVGDYWISTMWTGLDQSIPGIGIPLTYETMAFKGNHLEGVGDRRIYATRQQAEAGHAEVVAEIQQLIEQDNEPEPTMPTMPIYDQDQFRDEFN